MVSPLAADSAQVGGERIARLSTSRATINRSLGSWGGMGLPHETLAPGGGLEPARDNPRMPHEK